MPQQRVRLHVQVSVHVVLDERVARLQHARQGGPAMPVVHGEPKVLLDRVLGTNRVDVPVRHGTRLLVRSLSFSFLS